MGHLYSAGLSILKIGAAITAGVDLGGSWWTTTGATNRHEPATGHADLGRGVAINTNHWKTSPGHAYIGQELGEGDRPHQPQAVILTSDGTAATWFPRKSDTVDYPSFTVALRAGRRLMG